MPEPVYRYTIKQEGDELPPPDDAAAEAVGQVQVGEVATVAADPVQALGHRRREWTRIDRRRRRHQGRRAHARHSQE